MGFTIEVTDADRALADQTIDYIRENLCGKEGLTDYLYNLSVAISQASIGARLAGITASAVAYYMREQNKLEEAKKANLKPSEWMGAIGEKITFDATLVSVFPHESDFGVTFITKLITTAGEVLTWFASNDPRGESGDPKVAAENGELLPGLLSRITGTVKKHDTFRDQKQTVITRCKVWTAEGIKKEEEKLQKKAARDAKKAAKAAQTNQ